MGDPYTTRLLQRPGFDSILSLFAMCLSPVSLFLSALTLSCHNKEIKKKMSTDEKRKWILIIHPSKTSHGLLAQVFAWFLPDIYRFRKRHSSDSNTSLLKVSGHFRQNQFPSSSRWFPCSHLVRVHMLSGRCLLSPCWEKVSTLLFQRAEQPPLEPLLLLPACLTATVCDIVY